MTFYIGVDFHPHQQTLCWIDRETGAMETLDLAHDLEKVRQFYSSLLEPAVIGIEASSRAVWFENMIAETGHKSSLKNLFDSQKRKEETTKLHKSHEKSDFLVLFSAISCCLVVDFLFLVTEI